MKRALIILITIQTIVLLPGRAEDAVRKQVRSPKILDLPEQALVRDLNYAKQVRSTNSFDLQGQAVVDQYIVLLEKRLGGSDSEVIEAYDRLYEFSEREHRTTRRTTTLFSEFNFDYSGIPLIISQICRDSSQITPNDAAEIIRKQQSRSNDSRITDVLLKHLKTHQSFTNAIDYCVQQVARGNKSLRVPLAKLRIEYQRELIRGVLKEKRIDVWDPNVIDLAQLRTALAEAREGITENPNMLTEYDATFHEAFELFNTRQEAVSFYEFALSKAGSLVHTNSALALVLNDRLSEYKGSEKQQGADREKTK